MKHLILTCRVGTTTDWRGKHTLTSTCVLHYQIQSLLCLYYLKELDWRCREAKRVDGGGVGDVNGDGAMREGGKGGAEEI